MLFIYKLLNMIFLGQNKIYSCFIPWSFLVCHMCDNFFFYGLVPQPSRWVFWYEISWCIQRILQNVKPVKTFIKWCFWNVGFLFMHYVTPTAWKSRSPENTLWVNRKWYERKIFGHWRNGCNVYSFTNHLTVYLQRKWTSLLIFIRFCLSIKLISLQ